MMLQGMTLYADMMLCSGNIQQNCDLSLTVQENADISSCLSVMNTFSQEVEKCKSIPTSSGCSCWAALAGTADAVTACRDLGRAFVYNSREFFNYLKTLQHPIQKSR